MVHADRARDGAVHVWLLWRTRFGLRLRICGENPVAGESLGVNIYFQKYVGVIISGALAGLGGAFIAMELSGVYQEGQTPGRGFIGLAALIFGNWRPFGVLYAALLFGYPFGISLLDLDGQSTHALLLVLAIAFAGVAFWAFRRNKRSDTILATVLSIGMLVWYLLSDTAPDWLPNTMPYAIVLLTLVFASQRLRPPAADGHALPQGRALADPARRGLRCCPRARATPGCTRPRGSIGTARRGPRGELT